MSGKKLKAALYIKDGEVTSAVNSGHEIPHAASCLL